MTAQIRLEITKIIAKAYVMQLATSRDGQPWVCSVYFVADNKLNLYWLSWPSRRHSEELAGNPKAAVTMAIKTNLPIIGLGAEGAVEVVNDIETVKKIMPDYINKYGSGKDFMERFKVGNNEHQMYRFKPKKYVLFDEVNYPGAGSTDLLLEG